MTEYYDPKTARHFIDSLDKCYACEENYYKPKGRFSEPYDNLTPIEDKKPKKRAGRKRSDTPIEVRKKIYHERKVQKIRAKNGIYALDDIRRQSNRNMYDMLMYLYTNHKDLKVVSIKMLCDEYNLRGLRGGVLPGLISSGLCINTDIKNELKWVGKKPTRKSAVFFKQQYVVKYYTCKGC